MMDVRHLVLGWVHSEGLFLLLQDEDYAFLARAVAREAWGGPEVSGYPGSLFLLLGAQR